MNKKVAELKVNTSADYFNKVVKALENAGLPEEKDITIASNYKYSSISNVFKEIEEYTRKQMECREKTLAEIIQKYDFIVGSKECMCKLAAILPKGANIICSPYFVNPTIIYAIKKFDVSDLIETDKEVRYETDM